jgi:hypothetical protein
MGGRKKQRKGFAAMDPARVRQITAMGGRATHAAGKGRQWTPEQARAAALKRTPASRRAAARKAAETRRRRAAAAQAGQAGRA